MSDTRRSPARPQPADRARIQARAIARADRAFAILDADRPRILSFARSKALETGPGAVLVRFDDRPGAPLD